MSDICAVCESPTAKSFHFGAKSCKACAAFFRRAIALNVTYDCKGANNCLIHHERRYMCKSCRYDKCFAQGMQKELVQSKGKTSERERMMMSASPPSPTMEIPSVPSCSSETTIASVVNTYTRLESALSDRRRLMHTNLKIRDILGVQCECPFTREFLRPFDYRTFRGHQRPDFIMLFDYVRYMPQFDDLNKNEQATLFRYTCAVDVLMSMAYYSTKVAFEEKMMVHNDCTYYPLIPTPLTGTEPDAAAHFSSREDFEKYKSMIPPMVQNWDILVVPMYKLNPSFSEFALLKALVCWHICYYKFFQKGRIVCQNQRNLIIQALFSLSEQSGEEGCIRLGQLLLYITDIFEQVYDLVTSLYMVTFFGIMDTDPFVVDLLDQSNYV